VTAFFDARGSLRGVALLRIALGPLVIYSLWPYLREVAAGSWYGARYHAPYIASLPTLPAALWHALIVVGAVAGVCIALGLYARTACVTAALVIGGNMLLSETHYHHNRAVLTLVLALCALCGPGRELSLDAWRARRRGHPLDTSGLLWPLWLLRFELASTYLASGTSKLLDPDWRGGVVTWDRVLQGRPLMDRSPLPTAFIELISREDVHWFFGKSAIALELFVGLGLWSRRTRLAAIWFAVMFHVMVEISARVQVFSYLCLAALAIWAVPSVGDRRIAYRAGTPRAARLVALVGRLDWLGRFQIAPSSARSTAALTLTERDGAVFEGGAALRRTFMRLPLTFWPFALLSLPGIAPRADRLLARLLR